MRHPGWDRIALVISLSAAALSGCTRFAPGNSGRRFPIDTLRRTPAMQSIETPVPTEDAHAETTIATEATPHVSLPTESAPLLEAVVEPVFDDLNEALLELEWLLGSTEQWDILRP